MFDRLYQGLVQSLCIFFLDYSFYIRSVNFYCLRIISGIVIFLLFTIMPISQSNNLTQLHCILYILDLCFKIKQCMINCHGNRIGSMSKVVIFLLFNWNVYATIFFLSRFHMCEAQLRNTTIFHTPNCC